MNTSIDLQNVTAPMRLGVILHFPAKGDDSEFWTRQITLQDEHNTVTVTQYALSYDVLLTPEERTRNGFTPPQAKARLADIEPYTRPEANCFGALQALSPLNVDERQALVDVERDNDGVSLAQEYGGEG